MTRGRVLVAGFSTRHVAGSAFRAGYDVYAIDHFCDRDLSWYTRDCMKFENLEELPEKIGEMCRRYEIDYFVPTSGAERIAPPKGGRGILPDCAGRFLDKMETAHFFRENGIPSPELVPPNIYPCLLKPRFGAGGWRNRLIRTEEEFRRWSEQNAGVEAIAQEFVEGVPSSVSCISNGRGAVAIAANEQLLRRTEEAPFGFTGSITPLDHPFTKEAIRLAEKCAARSGCYGSLGMDLVLGERIWAIEVNPRFQATLDTVEMSTGCNLFQLHLDACAGRLPARMPEPCRYAARAILFADRDLEIRSDLSHLYPWVADIPWEGTEFEEGNAVVSVFGIGSSRSQAIEMLNSNIMRVRRYLDR
ncbi:MAG: ATP-grasp domain-containing protein [Methanomicrobiales archaeon]|nr:ATP-grasp domain-containing protein [Methanomicrobiales archaeon]